jgi:hypothetical protein
LTARPSTSSPRCDSSRPIFQGRLLGKASPIVVEVTPANHDLLIDLDAIKLDELLNQQRKKR